MNILLLGKGYIGNYLAKANTPHKIYHYSKQDVDYSNEEKFAKLIEDIQPNWIVNSSGYTGKPNVDACENDAWNCYHYNVTVPLLLTKVANNYGIPIIHIGSGCIYTGYENEFTEEDPSNFGVEQINSSFYSKTKDAFEKLSSTMSRYIFRIRIPFNGIPEPKNYLWKLLHYDTLISMPNSLTNVDELVSFVYKFIERDLEPGIYNVLNPGVVEAKEVVEMLEEYDLSNKNWKFVTVEDAKFKVERSNCKLLSKKLEAMGLQLTPIKESIRLAIEQYKKLSE